MRETKQPVPVGGIVIALVIILVVLVAGVPFGRGSALILGVVGGLAYGAWLAARRRWKRGRTKLD
jgi:hypothetical protein